MEAEKRKVLRYENGFKEEIRDILVENELALELNGESYNLNITMEDVEDFIYGFLFTSGKINSRADIVSLEIKGNTAICQTRDSGLSYSKKARARLDLGLTLDLIRDFNAPTEMFKKTKASHSCALYKDGQMVLRRDDIGRHNAMDKVIGAIVREDLDIENSLIYISGRLPLVMLEKLDQAGFDTIISLAKPTNRALDFAEERGIRVIGETRKMDEFTLYTSDLD